MEEKWAFFRTIFNTTQVYLARLLLGVHHATYATLGWSAARRACRHGDPPF
jgi:hypothetical protein